MVIEGKIPNIRYVGNAFASLLIKFTTGYSKIITATAYTPAMKKKHKKKATRIPSMNLSGVILKFWLHPSNVPAQV